MDDPGKTPQSVPSKKTSYRHKARLPLPFARFAPFLMATRHAKLAKRVGAGAPRHLAAVVEYLAA